eukprot:COSAG04_NODE_1671_length_5986_cov_2.949720_2_plen_81_part_00
MPDNENPLEEEQVQKSPHPSQPQSSTARQEASARHAARASASVGKLAIRSLPPEPWRHIRPGICVLAIAIAIAIAMAWLS